MARLGVAIVGGAALGFASACNDILPLDCDAKTGVTEACTPMDTGNEATGTTSPTSASVSGSDVDTGSPTEPTSIGDTGSFCGDGVVDPDEECDDGDPIDIDECSNTCRLPLCGDGLVQPGEDCDLGMANDDHGACRLDCSAAICGDGIVRWGVESCDGADTGGSTCVDFGFGGGRLSCDSTCEFDVTNCSVCPDGMGCDAYQPCDGFCDSGAPCWSETGGLGTCLPSCTMPDECPWFEMFIAECTGELCVIPCEQDCPLDMICQMSQLYPGMVCLW